MPLVGHGSEESERRNAHHPTFLRSLPVVTLTFHITPNHNNPSIRTPTSPSLSRPTNPSSTTPHPLKTNFNQSLSSPSRFNNVRFCAHQGRQGRAQAGSQAGSRALRATPLSVPSLPHTIITILPRIFKTFVILPASSLPLSVSSKRCLNCCADIDCIGSFGCYVQHLRCCRLLFWYDFPRVANSQYAQVDQQEDQAQFPKSWDRIRANDELDFAYKETQKRKHSNI